MNALKNGKNRNRLRKYSFLSEFATFYCNKKLQLKKYYHRFDNHQLIKTLL